MRINLILILSLFYFLQANSQIIVTGQVISSDDSFPVIGASVFEVGNESNGTLTDIDGKYSVTVPENATLRFSYLGYATQEIKVDGKTNIDVVLAEDSYQLDKVVVTAYGIEKEKKATGLAP